jgi:hypothetical protein
MKFNSTLNINIIYFKKRLYSFHFAVHMITLSLLLVTIASSSFSSKPSIFLTAILPLLTSPFNYFVVVGGLYYKHLVKSATIGWNSNV